jgi:glycosyltransferase involved in cell wall biosynthesis
MFETERLPPGWAGLLNRGDGVLIPSNWCRDAMLASGVKVPIHVVNHGVFQEDVPAPRALPSVPFRFLSVLQWTERKNPAALLEAYWLEFAQEEPVSLVLKVTPWGTDDTIAAEIAAVRARLGLRAYASLEVVREDMTQPVVWSLINSCHAYVSAHCAEGFGNPLLEAMACGKPVIATGYSGNLEFMNHTNSMLVDYTLAPVGVVRPSLRLFYAPDMTWAHVSIPALRRAMRTVYEGGALVQGMAANAREDVRRQFNPTQTAIQFHRAVERIKHHAAR